MKSVEGFYQRISERLDALRIRQKHLNISVGLLQFLTFLVTSAFFLLAAEALLHLSSTTRLVLVSLIIIMLLSMLILLIGRPLYSRFFRSALPNDIEMALRVGHHFRDIRDRLADALQVFLKHQSNDENYSLELADASLSEIYQETEPLDFQAVASKTPLRKMSRLFAGCILVSLLLFAVFNSSMSSAAIRLLNPTVDFNDKLSVRFHVEPGNVEVVKGENLEIQVRLSGKIIPQASLLVRNKESDRFDRFVHSSRSDSTFTFLLENIRQNKIYYAATESQRTSEFRIDITERPLVRSLQLKLIYPNYSKLGTLFLDENVGDVSALRGTKVELTAQLSKLATAKIVFDGEREQPLKVASQTLQGTFQVTQNGSYHIALEDLQGLKNDAPIEYRISALADQQPAVRITFPGQDVDLNKDLNLPLSIEAEDDFGISKLRLGYTILQQGFEEGETQFLDLPLTVAGSDKVLMNYDWLLTKLNLMPEDVVVYFAEAIDNDLITGPKHARSASYRARFPSIYEMYEEVAQTHDEAIEELGEMYDETKELKDVLDDVVQQMKRDPELNWEDKQNIQETAEAQQDVREKLEQLQEHLDQMVDRMEQNDLVSPETLEKYRELQSLIQEMLTEEMREALAELQKSADQLDPRQMKEALENLQANQEDFLKSMERTLNLLKKMQVEQKLDESLRKAQDLLRRQEELNKEASAGDQQQNQKQNEKYAQDQQRIKQDAEDLEKSLEDLSQKMSEFPQMPKEQVDQAKSELSEGDAMQQMQQAVQQFQAGQMGSAQKSGQKASQSMQQMIQSLQMAQNELAQKEKKRIMQALRQTTHDLLDLSKSQESLAESSQHADRNSPELGELAETQQNLLSGLNRVAEKLYNLAQSTFFVTPEMGKAVAKAMQGMQGSTESLEARNPGKSGKSQGDAMSGLNEAAAQARQSMQSLNSASSGIGFQEMMERLMGLSGQQQDVNQQTQGMNGQGGGEQDGLKMSEQAAMQRLAAQQDAIRKSLRQLMKEAGQQSNLLGDMNKVGQDMEEVVKELRKNSVDRRLLERQQKILSRLLDAQRSMNDRDFSRKRKAETAKFYETASPNALSENLGQRNERLENELLKAMKEGYSKDYKELIKKYFEAITAEEARVNQE